jgi:hypothetical protein
MEGESSQLHNRRRCLESCPGHYSPDKSSRRKTLHNTEFPIHRAEKRSRCRLTQVLDDVHLVFGDLPVSI